MFRLKPFLMTASLLGSLFGFTCGPVSAQVAPVQPAPTALQGPEQRVALVIGNANYKNAPQLANPVRRNRESCGLLVPTEAHEEIAAGLESGKEVERRDASTRAVRLVTVD